MKVLIETMTEIVNETSVEKSIYLESDSLQFILKKYNGKVSVSKEGKESDQYETLGYYTNIHSALGAIMKMKIKDSTATNLQELIEDIRRIEGGINRMFSVEIASQQIAV